MPLRRRWRGCGRGKEIADWKNPFRYYQSAIRIPQFFPYASSLFSTSIALSICRGSM